MKRTASMLLHNTVKVGITINREFLTGFHKRKQERLKHAHAHMEKKYLNAKKEFRQAVSVISSLSSSSLASLEQQQKRDEIKEKVSKLPPMPNFDNPDGSE